MPRTVDSRSSCAFAAFPVMLGVIRSLLASTPSAIPSGGSGVAPEFHAMARTDLQVAQADFSVQN